MKQALIVGISGQDGPYLAQLLLNNGYHVDGTSRDVLNTSFANLDALDIRKQVSLHSLPLNDLQNVMELLTKVEPDEIYYLAGPSSVGMSFDKPAEFFMSICSGVLNLLEAVRLLRAPIRLINASTCECFGNTLGEAATESTPFLPLSPYAVAKTAAHFLVANYRNVYNLFACSGILFNHESPFRPNYFVTRKIVSTACRIAAGSKERLEVGNLEVARDWGYAPEYMAAMWRILQQDKLDDYIIATGATITLKDFTAEVFASLGLDWREHVTVNPAFYRKADVVVSRANPIKAERELGWKATLRPTDVARALVAHELSHSKEKAV